MERLLDEGGGCVVIVGEPGIGKTRLAEAIRRRSEVRGRRVHAARASEHEADVAFGLVARALGAEPRAAAERHEIRAVVEELAAERGLALILDDLQWADSASLELVGQLVARPAARTLLVLAHRVGQLPGRLEAALLAGINQGSVEVLEPGPLSETEARELAGPGIDVLTLRALHADSGGNPFYLEQLVRSVRADSPARELDDQPPPQRIAAAVAHELSRAPRPARRLLAAAAVAGEPFEPGLVAEIAAIDDEQALAAIDDLAAWRLIRVTEDRMRFVFRHPVVRRSVYGAVPARQRRDAHRRAAAALERRGARIEVLAHHVDRSAAAGDVDAAALLARAGRAAAAHAPAAAAHWFSTAAALLPAGHPDEERVELMLARARALASTGHFDSGHRAFEEVLALAPETTPGIHARVVGAISRLEHWSGRSAEARGRLERALALLGGARSVEATRLRVELGYDHWMAGDVEPALRLARQGLADARQFGGGLQMRAAALAALSEGLNGSPAAARELLDEAARLADRLPDDELDDDLEGLSWLAMGQADLGTQQAALRNVKRAIEGLRAAGQASLFAPNLALQAHVETVLGRLDDAAEHATAALEAATLVGNQQHRMWALTTVCATEIWRGHLVAALAAGKQAAALARSGCTGFFASHARVWHAIALLASGRPARARSELLALASVDRLDSLAAGLLPRWAEALALAQLRLGELDAAESTLRAAEGTFRELGFSRPAGLLMRGQAALLTARGEHRSGVEHAFRAVEALHRRGRLLDAAYARALAGRCLAAAGETRDAVSELSATYQQLMVFGANGYRNEVARDLRRLDAGRPRDASAPHARLTRREREVAALVADGLTNRQVAEALVLAPKTVENHVTRILDKLQVGSRAALPAALERDG